MSDLFRPFVAIACSGRRLSDDEMTDAIGLILDGDATPAQIGAFLAALSLRGETVEEVVAAARVLRARCATIEAPAGAIDTCGVGGDGLGTFNISTTAGLIAASCGVKVAKHGNRAASSKSGSSDVLAALGARVDAAPETVSRCIDQAGFGFLFAPAYHTAMRAAAAPRREMGVRTLFNLLGPLSNPAGARRQLLGVNDRRWVRPMAEALRGLGAEKAWVVHGLDGMDEITTTAPTHIAELAHGAITEFEIEPEEFGLRRSKISDLEGGDAPFNAAALREVLSPARGTRGAYRDIASLNAAAALVIADAARDLTEGLARAVAAIEAGDAMRVLDKFIKLSNT
ncbi:MAG: anthranilate phosphoribosyltransferase [Pseudomonadota bacterium]